MRSNVQSSRSLTEQVRAAHSQFATALHPKKMGTRIRLLANKAEDEAPATQHQWKPDHVVLCKIDSRYGQVFNEFCDGALKQNQILNDLKHGQKGPLKHERQFSPSQGSALPSSVDNELGRRRFE